MLLDWLGASFALSGAAVLNVQLAGFSGGFVYRENEQEQEEKACKQTGTCIQEKKKGKEGRKAGRKEGRKEERKVRREQTRRRQRERENLCVCVCVCVRLCLKKRNKERGEAGEKRKGRGKKRQQQQHELLPLSTHSSKKPKCSL